MCLRLLVSALPDSSPTLVGSWSHLEDLFDSSGNTLAISLPSGQSQMEANSHIAFEGKILASFPPTPNFILKKKNSLYSCAEMSGMLI